MNFTYSICHPDTSEIERKNTPISKNEVLEIAKNYPWEQKLDFMESLGDKVFYNPSVDFKCSDNGQSFCLTAIYDDSKKLMFSLWYNRPKKVKKLFGLLGESEKMVVDDYWTLNLEDSLSYLEHFTDGNYPLVEKLYI